MAFNLISVGMRKALWINDLFGHIKAITGRYADIGWDFASYSVLNTSSWSSIKYENHPALFRNIVKTWRKLKSHDTHTQ